MCGSFEIGKPLKVVNFTELMLDTHASTSRSSADPDALKRTPLSRAFQDARLMDAVLVLESFQIDLFMINDGSGGGAGSSSDGSFKLMLDMLLYDMERFPGVVIMVVTSRLSLDLAIHRCVPTGPVWLSECLIVWLSGCLVVWLSGCRLHPDFMRRVKFLVDFPSPSLKQRVELWRQLMPTKAPLSDDVNFTKLAEVI